MEQEGSPWLYFGGCDVARGGSFSKGTGTPGISVMQSGDDFAFGTLRILSPEGAFRPGDFGADPRRMQLVHMARKTGMDAAQMSALIHGLDRIFNYQFILMDPRGGGLFVRDELRKSMQTTGGTTFPTTPIITASDQQLAGLGKKTLVFFDRGESRFKEAGLTFPSESSLVNKAHDVLKTAIEKQEVVAPPTWSGWPAGGAMFGNVDQMRRWLNNQQGIIPRDRANAEIDLALLQLVQIERETDAEGNPALDKFGMFSFTSKRKKDSAYALLYGHFAVWLWRQIYQLQGQMGPVDQEMAIDSESA